MTHYEILGIDEAAGAFEIKRAYRAMVKLYHPDVNPSEEAKTRIVRITEAYEVLSDPLSRERYDWTLHGVYVPEPKPVVSEYELRRREYVRRKREQEQKHWEQLFLMKTKFYRYQRLFAYPFILISLMFSIDYFITPERMVVELREVKLSPAGYAVAKAGPFQFQADPSFYQEALDAGSVDAHIHYSAVFDKPVGVSLKSGQYFHFHGTLHSFGNIFSYILLALALVLVSQKQYNDFVMTLGILPFFITLFLFALAL